MIETFVKNFMLNAPTSNSLQKCNIYMACDIERNQNRQMMRTLFLLKNYCFAFWSSRIISISNLMFIVVIFQWFRIEVSWKFKIEIRANLTVRSNVCRCCCDSKLMYVFVCSECVRAIMHKYIVFVDVFVLASVPFSIKWLFWPK